MDYGAASDAPAYGVSSVNVCGADYVAASVAVSYDGADGAVCCVGNAGYDRVAGV